MRRSSRPVPRRRARRTPRPAPLPTVLLAVLLVALLGLGLASAGVVPRHPSEGASRGAGAHHGRAAAAAPAPSGRRTATPSDAGAVAVLRAWDARRARAWGSGDVAALRRLYTPGSVAGVRDRALLRAWTERGLRVRGLEVQLLAVRVQRRAPRLLVLVVTDRVARAVARGPGTRVVLPRGAARTRVVALRRSGGGWRVSAVRAQASPAARTASTSGS